MSASKIQVTASESENGKSTRPAGMHLGHDLLQAVTVATALLATLALYIAHCR